VTCTSAIIGGFMPSNGMLQLGLALLFVGIGLRAIGVPVNRALVVVSIGVLAAAGFAFLIWFLVLTVPS